MGWSAAAGAVFSCDFPGQQMGILIKKDTEELAQSQLLPEGAEDYKW